MSAGGGDLERAARQRLAVDVREIAVERRARCGRRRRQEGWRAEPHRVVQRADGFGERPHRIELETADDCGFAAVGVRQEQRVTAMATRRGGNRQHAARRLNAAVERQLAKEQDAGDIPPGDLAAGREDSQGDWEIERRARFSDVGWRQVHRDTVRRKLEAGVADSAPHAIAAFPHAGVRQAHHLKRGQSKRDVDLHLHQTGVDSKHRGCPHAGKHR